MALTGREGHRPLGPPAPLVGRLRELGALLSKLTGDATPEPLELLAERAAIMGLSRHGSTSCGATTRLIRTGDGWLAVSLAREDDENAVAAWLELDEPPPVPWEAIADAAIRRSTDWLESRAILLGLPAAALPCGQRRPPQGAGPFRALPVHAEGAGETERRRTTAPMVVDLSSLWAGPLCGHLLHLGGAHVVKVESRARPDGAREGPEAFFDLLNHGKRSVALDFERPDGMAALRRLVKAADVVIEASRPRALDQLGLTAENVVRAADGPSVWISITGHGRAEGDRDRVAFGDDAAVAGGLVVWDGEGPCFCADAVADPLTGVVAATAALLALETGKRWLVDVPMAGVAAAFAGPTLDAAMADGPVAAPRARHPAGKASPLGQDTRAVLSALDS